MVDYVLRRNRGKKSKHRLLLTILSIVLIALGGSVAGLYGWQHRAPVEKPDMTTKAPKSASTQVTPKPKPPLINLQPTLDAWVAKQKGDFGIVVYDPDNQQVIAEHQGDKQFYTASIYKLYVVYLQLVDIQLAKRDPTAIVRGTQTRQQCMDAAIRTSDSPCAETLMADLGNANINQRLQAYGLTNTSFPSFVTSAADAVKVLARLQGHRDLDNDSTAFLRGVMKEQIYRNGLPLGMPEAIVSDKVGFSETPNYHDVGIISLPNGREYIVAVLSQGASSRQIADLGKTIYEVLK